MIEGHPTTQYIHRASLASASGWNVLINMAKKHGNEMNPFNNPCKTPLPYYFTTVFQS